MAGVIGLLVCKTVNLYIEKTYGDVKADASTKNDDFEENKELLSKNEEMPDYDYDYQNEFNPGEKLDRNIDRLDINSYSYVKNELTALNTDY